MTGEQEHKSLHAAECKFLVARGWIGRACYERGIPTFVIGRVPQDHKGPLPLAPIQRTPTPSLIFWRDERSSALLRQREAVLIEHERYERESKVST